MEQLLPSYRPPRELPGPLPGVIRTNAPTGGSQRVRRKPHLDGTPGGTGSCCLPGPSSGRSPHGSSGPRTPPRFHGGPRIRAFLTRVLILPSVVTLRPQVSVALHAAVRQRGDLEPFARLPRGNRLQNRSETCHQSTLTNLSGFPPCACVCVCVFRPVQLCHLDRFTSSQVKPKAFITKAPSATFYPHSLHLRPPAADTSSPFLNFFHLKTSKNEPPQHVPS